MTLDYSEEQDEMPITFVPNNVPNQIMSVSSDFDTNMNINYVDDIDVGDKNTHRPIPSRPIKGKKSRIKRKSLDDKRPMRKPKLNQLQSKSTKAKSKNLQPKKQQPKQTQAGTSQKLKSTNASASKLDDVSWQKVDSFDNPNGEKTLYGSFRPSPKIYWLNDTASSFRTVFSSNLGVVWDNCVMTKTQ